MATSSLSTQFNPFGEHETDIYTLANSIRKRTSDFKTEIMARTSKADGNKIEDKEFADLMAQLSKICKKVDVSAVQPLLSSMAAPLSEFIEVLSENSELLRQAEMVFFCRSISQIVQIFADRIQGPFTSSLLDSCASLFESLLTAKHFSLKDTGVVLWKSTFSTVTTPLRYPGKLRNTLGKLPKKCAIFLPPEEKHLLSLSSPGDEGAMDGMESASVRNERKLTSFPAETNVSQSTFEFSQQPAADTVATKLLSEVSFATDKQVEKDKTPLKRRAVKIESLMDEESCDFIPITATPPSSKRSQLTDRQKEQFSEAAGPRTTVNYVDEESQCGVQKEKQIKNALTALNFDLGEGSETSSMAGLASQKEKVNLNSPVRRSTRNHRKLFDSVPNSETQSADDGSSIPPTELISEEAKINSSTQEKISPISDRFETPPRKGRQKKTPQKIDSQPVKKRLRSAKLPHQIISEITTEDCIQSGELEMASPPTKKQCTPSIKNVEVLMNRSVETSGNENDHSVLKTNVHADNELKLVPTQDQANLIKNDEQEFISSPPKTPRTPSILRISKRFEESPGNDRKKNRVHFNEESLPQEQKVFESAELIPTQSMVYDDLNSASPFYKTLVDCKDPVEKVVRKLAPMSLKTAVDAVKKSLNKAGVKTIGEFAALSTKQLNEICGLKHPKEKCARNVLKEYEEKKKKESLALAEQVVSQEDLKSYADSTPSVENIETEQVTPETAHEFESSSSVTELISKDISNEQTRSNDTVQATNQNDDDAQDKHSLPSGAASISFKDVVITPSTVKTIKKEIISPSNKDTTKNTQISTEETFMNDCLFLHQVCSNLSRAHSLNLLGSNTWTAIFDTINKSAILFKNIVMERGARLSEWGCVDVSMSSLSGEIFAPEHDIEKLCGVYKRFSRHHTLDDLTNDNWRCVMETINEAAVLLRSIITDATLRK